MKKEKIQDLAINWMWGRTEEGEQIKKTHFKSKCLTQRQNIR